MNYHLKSRQIATLISGEVPHAPKARLDYTSATRAKVLKGDQFRAVIDAIQFGKTPLRDTVMILLSFFCGLRAQEIAGIQWWRNVLNADGTVAENIHVTKDIGKRTIARTIPMNPQLRAMLTRLRKERPNDKYVIYSLMPNHIHRRAGLEYGQTHPNTIAQYLRRLYRACGFNGCTSHSGRRTFITNLMRRCNEVQCSVRDVQVLAGHASLDTTMVYMEPAENHHDLVKLVF